MTSTPLVSIIIPCYNAAPRLAACLQSCFAQTYSNLEIILVDNNSTDDSARIAQHFAAHSAHPMQLLHCTQRGANYARNYGLIHAQGDYIQWLDADDELAPDKIALQVKALVGVGAECIACADWDWHYDQENKLRFRLGFAQLCWEDTFLQCLLHHWHPPHAYLIHRAVAEQLHRLQAWYPGATIGNDREYFTTAALIGCRFLAVPGAKVHYFTWSEAQLTRSTPDSVRVKSLQQVWERLRSRLPHRPLRQISGLHWLLLRQSWQVWEFAPGRIQSFSPDCFWLETREEGGGISLARGEQRIVQALLQLLGGATLDDHAHQILRLLWRQVVRLPQVSVDTVGAALAQWVGLLPDAGWEEQAGGDREPEKEALIRLIDTVPLYAPLFPEVRLAILQCLERLRGAGLFRLLPLASVQSESGCGPGSQFPSVAP